jgi:hypothetical protein
MTVGQRSAAQYGQYSLLISTISGFPDDVSAGAWIALGSAVTPPPPTELKRLVGSVVTDLTSDVGAGDAPVAEVELVGVPPELLTNLARNMKAIMPITMTVDQMAILIRPRLRSSASSAKRSLLILEISSRLP